MSWGKSTYQPVKYNKVHEWIFTAYFHFLFLSIVSIFTSIVRRPLVALHYVILVASPRTAGEPKNHTPVPAERTYRPEPATCSTKDFCRCYKCSVCASVIRVRTYIVHAPRRIEYIVYARAIGSSSVMNGLVLMAAAGSRYFARARARARGTANDAQTHAAATRTRVRARPSSSSSSSVS